MLTPNKALTRYTGHFQPIHSPQMIVCVSIYGCTTYISGLLAFWSWTNSLQLALNHWIHIAGPVSGSILPFSSYLCCKSVMQVVYTRTLTICMYEKVVFCLQHPVSLSNVLILTAFPKRFDATHHHDHKKLVFWSKYTPNNFTHSTVWHDLHQFFVSVTYSIFKFTVIDFHSIDFKPV